MHMCMHFYIHRTLPKLCDAMKPDELLRCISAPVKAPYDIVVVASATAIGLSVIDIARR